MSCLARTFRFFPQFFCFTHSVAFTPRVFCSVGQVAGSFRVHHQPQQPPYPPNQELLQQPSLPLCRQLQGNNSEAAAEKLISGHNDMGLATGHTARPIISLRFTDYSTRHHFSKRSDLISLPLPLSLIYCALSP